MKAKTISMFLFALMMGTFGVALLCVVPTPQAGATQPTKLEKKAIEPEKAELSDAPVADTAEAVVVEPPAAPPTDAPVVVDMDWLLNKETAIASLLMLLLTFFSKWVPGLNAIGDTGKRALVSGLTVIVGFLVVKFVGPGEVDWGSFASLGITYLLTSLSYDKGLKPLGVKTPKVGTV